MRIAAILLLTTATTAQTRHTAPKPATPIGPAVLLDTTLGRITCRLYPYQAPLATARFLTLANDNFYDGTLLNGISDGILGGAFRGPDKLTTGDLLPYEKTGFTYDRPGLLILTSPPSNVPAGAKPPDTPNMFSILEHADMEYEKRGGTIFGQCTDDSLPIITAISHAMLTVDNRPTTALTLNHITIIQPGDNTPPPPPPVPAPGAETLTAAPPTPSAIPAPEPTGPTAIIETTRGPLTCRLFKETPIATGNFIGLATGTKDWHLPSTQALQHNRRYYDGLSFRRVIPDFMIQQSDMPSDPTGDGDIGFHFDNEIIPGLTFDRPGRLAYANAGPNTNSAEWFITEHPTHRLDGRFTIFGQCDPATIATAATIARTPRDDHNRPLTPITIKHITIQ